jgi:hypothetical protein
LQQQRRHPVRSAPVIVPRRLAPPVQHHLLLLFRVQLLAVAAVAVAVAVVFLPAQLSRMQKKDTNKL